MALAFKRAVSEAEVPVAEVNKSIQGWYNTTVSPAFVVDYDGIKTVEGVSTKNPNEVEGPKNITLVNWVKDNASYFHSVWGDVQYKDKENAIPILLKHLERVVLHVDDKSPAGKYNTYSVEWKGKECHITVHIDFSNYPQSLNLSDTKDDTAASVDQLVWDHLDVVANIGFELKKLQSATGEYKTYKRYLDEKLKKDFPLAVDWDAIVTITGKSIEYSNKPPVPNRTRAVTFLEEGRGFYNVYYAIEKLVSDELGMQAFGETFDKILVSVATSTEDRSGPHAVTKEGKTLKITFKLNFDNLQNASVDYSELAKQIEALL